MTKLIVANWKMNGSKSFIDSYFNSFKKQQDNQVVFCPPFLYLDRVNNYLEETNFALGAQDCHNHESGAFTGNISAGMLKEIGCRYVILGHSERRQYHSETDALVREKSETAIKAGLMPIVCAGESLEDRQSKKHLEVVKRQLEQSLPSSLEKCVIAYEPVWAIGTGLTATTNDINEMHQMIADFIGHKVPVLYGGSVTADNAPEILSQLNVGGVLVGGASLKPDVFNKICQVAI